MTTTSRKPLRSPRRSPLINAGTPRLGDRGPVPHQLPVRYLRAGARRRRSAPHCARRRPVLRCPEIRAALHYPRGAPRADDGESLVTTVRHLLQPLGLTEQPPEGRQAREKWEPLAALAQLAETIAAQRPEARLADFVAELHTRAATEHAPGFDGVTLASLHAAKGLEWDAVFLVGLTEGLLPIIYAETPEQVEEERRLFYVGVTRAREHLHLSWALARSPGGRRTRTPSRFLDGLRPAAAAPARQHRERHRKKDRMVRCRVCGATLLEAVERTLGRCQDCPASVNEELLERLRHWRREAAALQKVPAFVIFTDATLQAIAEQEPSTAAQLARISGVGERKLRRYSEALDVCGWHTRAGHQWTQRGDTVSGPPDHEGSPAIGAGEEGLRELLDILDLEQIEVNIFRGRSPAEGPQRIFGGQVAGQALVAAGRTVAEDRFVHSLHAYFIRPGDPSVPIVYHVDRVRDGRSFTTRRVTGIQHGKAIFTLRVVPPD